MRGGEGAPSRAQIRAAIDVLKRADRREIQGLGWHFQRKNFDSPLNDIEFLEANRDLWEVARTPAGIEWRLDEQVSVAREVGAFAAELRDVPEDSDATGSGGAPAFHWKNGMWNNADAIVQYGLVRSRRPRRYVEVGCGWSSLLLAMALERNLHDGAACEVVQVEPYPNESVMRALPAQWTLHRVVLQRAPLEVFEGLGPGDVLFYDGSHVARMASDVNWFFFEVLPRLRAGVLIHVHDVFFPVQYPRPWVIGRAQTWNEQWVLQAFLMHNDAYRVLIANRMLAEYRRAEVAEAYRGVRPPGGGSLWMVKVRDGSVG
ncbi:MAG: class I SAM-dependent methyltransferase [Phycisphaeraceae bacterium]|nr:class I SAM-dependent methyltransferase [Phycisphaeraceae bacterium]